MIARLACYDPLRMDNVYSGVRVRDGIFAYIEMLREEVLTQFRHEQTLFVTGGGGKNAKPPKLPALLRPKRRKRKPGEAYVEPPKPAFIERMEQEKEGAS